MELYVERGFEQTTVADIAERAGLTERTFFRYFADKREVLFAGGERAAGAARRTVAARARRRAPLDAVAPASTPSPRFFGDRRDSRPARQSVIDSNAELQERELIKMAAIARRSRMRCGSAACRSRRPASRRRRRSRRSASRSRAGSRARRRP